jgi:hypothetical protein
MESLKTAITKALAQATGARAETENTPPSLNSTPSPKKFANEDAIAATDRLFGWCRMADDVGDAKVFLAAVASILSDYPAAVMEAIADPRTGSRVLNDYPTISQIRQACDKLYEPIERQLERERYKALPEPTLRPRMSEEQARVEEQIAAFRRTFGIPEGGLPPRGVQARVLTAMSKARVRAVLDDCAARKARKEQESV